MFIKFYQKYLLSFLVAVYTLAAVGIPVYLHYCGGELEEVSYIMKGSNCCGDDEPADGCCKDEGLVLKCNPDITFKKHDVQLAPVQVQQLFSLFHISFRLPFEQETKNRSAENNTPPLLQKYILDTTVLRI